MSEGHTNYAKIYWTLMVLFIISVVGPEIPWPENLETTMILITAFGIAVVKAIIVAGWFMHLAHEKKYIWYGFITSLALLFLFVIAVAPDVTMTKGHNWQSQIPSTMDSHEGHDETNHDDHGHH